MSVKSRLLIINCIGLVCITLVAAASHFNGRSTQVAIEHYNATVVKKQIALDDLLAATGYGGSIHHMKNYVLRQDPQYLNLYYASRQKADHAISDYRAAGQLTTTESASLAQIRDMLVAYDAAIVTASKMEADAESIDQAVVVDDTHFFIAITALRNWLNAQNEAMSDQIITATAQAQQQTVAVTLIAFALVGGLGTVYANRLAKRVTTREEADRAKSAFLANMSHEIRTPMTAILGYADLLQTDESFAKDRASFEMASKTIRSNASYLLRVINDILDMSKIESGKLTIEKIKLSPAHITEDIASIMRPQALAKGIDFNLHYDSPIPATITSDPTRLKQILLNLTSNAVKFTDTGCVEVHVSYDPYEQQLRYKVTDTGVGLTRKQLEKINQFEAFVQADAATTRRFGGTGLGLRVARSLAAHMGGQLRIESAYGHGSTFHVSIDAGDLADTPMIEPDNIANILQHQREQRQQNTDQPVPAKSLKGLRILLAEDGLDNQRLITHHLKAAGAHVTVADNGRIALDLFNQAQGNEPYQLILSDMQMPEVDGYELTRRLRAAGHSVPILALTAHVLDGSQRKCLEAGCDAYLSKPIDKYALVEACLRWAQQKNLTLVA